MEVKNPVMIYMINGWFELDIPVRNFLAGFSYLGGTYHSVMVYGSVIDIVSDFGKIMGWKVYEI